MDSEWDVLAEIWTTMAQLENKTIAWVKGHQDNDKPYEDLPLRAQLNCDADSIANAFIEGYPDHPYSHVPLLPTSGVQLNLPVGTVTHKLKREIRLARTEPSLRKHLINKFGWTEEAFEDIDWESFRRAMKNLDKHRTTLTKHVNNITPVGRRVNRYDPKYSANCSSCGEADESPEHLMLCPNRDQWRKDCMKALRDFFKDWDTPLDAQELLLEGIKSVLEGRTADTIPIADSVAHIALTQEAIGWEELFRGRLSKSWKLHQTAHLGDRATEEVNGKTWGSALAKTLLQQWYNLWIEWNQDRHGKDQQSQEVAASRQALR